MFAPLVLSLTTTTLHDDAKHLSMNAPFFDPSDDNPDQQEEDGNQAGVFDVVAEAAVTLEKKVAAKIAGKQAPKSATAAVTTAPGPSGASSSSSVVPMSGPMTVVSPSEEDFLGAD